MRMTSNGRQALRLQRIKGFPKADTLIKVRTEELTKGKGDTKELSLFTEEKMTETVPGWTLGRMIAGLPGSITYCRCLEDDDDFVTYSLRINRMYKEKMVRVNYESFVVRHSSFSSPYSITTNSRGR